jgi:class 3 adenylate cyclase/tetratricopeptide (TPR) repeat protein
MQCPRCHYEATPDAEFCPECGSKLALVCARCGVENARTYKFCKKCGEPLGLATAGPVGSTVFRTPKYLVERIFTSKPSLDPERKRVTVLFADIKSSLEILTGRDPEDARRLLDTVLEKMVDAVHKYEGTVNHFMGDGIMALFGAPVAREDHAIRACYSALLMQELIKKYSDELRRTEGFPVQVRIGLNSGEVIVRAIQSDLHVDYTAIGETVHLAARMEQIATPGSILAGASVFKLAQGYVNLKSLGPLPVKGLARPVDVFEVVGVGPIRSRLQAAATRGLTQFVGRDLEIHALQKSLELSIGGHGQVVAVVGEAGVGKSRLLYEFTHAQGAKSNLVLEASSSSYGRATSYRSVIDLLKDYFRINPHDDIQAIREKVTNRVLLLDQSLLESIPPVLDLFEALPEDHSFRSLDPIQRRHQTAQAFKRLILRESRVQPIILIFEDLHWNDSLSLSLLDHLVDGLADERVLLLVSYRSEYQDDWSSRTHYRCVHLDPLSRDGIEELLTGLLGSDPGLFAVKHLLVDRAGGNPFFLEEIVQTLIETDVLTGSRGRFRLAVPVSNIQVPPQVQAIISARLDRLPTVHKQVIQAASVIGKDVSFVLLRALTVQTDEELRGCLADLVTAEFLYETKLFPDLEYAFKHALTLKVANDSLTKERRRKIHAAIVEAIESLYSDRLAEQIERLAHHAYHGEVWPKALAYLREAGGKSVDRRANWEAVSLFKQAMEALQHLPEDRGMLEQSIDLRFDIRNALQPLGDLRQIHEFLKEAENLALRLNDQQRLGWVSAYLTEHFRMLGDPKVATDSGERALAIGQSLNDLRLQVVTNIPMGLLYHALGDYPRAIDFFQWNIDRIPRDLLHERFGLFGLPSVFSRVFLTYCLAELGEFSKGNSIVEEGVRIANAADHTFSQVYAYLGVGYLYIHMGDFHRAIPVLERALALGQFTQIPVAFAYGASYLGYALAHSGRVNEGLRFLEQSTDETISTRFVARHSLRLAYLAECYLLGRRSNDAATAAKRSLEFAQNHHERGHEAYALRLLGEVYGLDDPATAEQYYRSSLLITEALSMRPLEAQCHWGLARIFRRMNDRDRLEYHFAAAKGLLQKMELARYLTLIETEFQVPDGTRLSITTR